MKRLTLSSLLLTAGMDSSKSVLGFVSPMRTIQQTPSLRPQHAPFLDKFQQKSVYLPTSPNHRRDVSVGLFRDLLRKIRDQNDDEDDKNKTDKPTSNAAEDSKSEDGSKTGSDGSAAENVPYFAASDEPSSQQVEAKEKETELQTAPLDEPSKEEEKSDAEKETPPPITANDSENEPAAASETVTEDDSALSQAEKLRAQAARIRLEAEKRQVELTLEKIEKVNKKLDTMKKQEKVDEKDQKVLEEELLRLKSQLEIDEKGITKPVASTSVPTKSAASAGGDTDAVSSSSSSAVSTSITTSLSTEELDDRVKKFKESPEYLKVLVAKVAGFGVDSTTPGAVDRLNATDVVLKLHKDEVDYMKGVLGTSEDGKLDTDMARASLERAYAKSKSMEDVEQPKFTEEQIQEKVKEFEKVPAFLRDFNAAQGFNETDIALMLLEEEWKEEKRRKERKIGGVFGLFGGDKEEKGSIGRDGERMDLEKSGTFSRLFTDDSMNSTSYGKASTDLSLMMESLYPKSTRKEDETPSERQVNIFLNDVVAPTKAFVPSGNPISVPGGWIIRGTNQCDSGDELIEKLDKRFSSDVRLNEKITFFLVKDPFPNPEEQMLDPTNWPQVLYVCGPNVSRDPAPIVRTIISAFGIATAWYTSIYPFLGNSKLLDRATEAVELADAGMQTDLSWLSDLSIPLFLSFMALQLSHDVAHRLVANRKKFDVTIPTLVPSIFSGITNSITSLQSSPKNKQDLFDFAISGPLTGMLCSILALSYGLVLTATADPSAFQTFPGLPLLILRQSSLGGGLVSIILGNGVLDVPMSAAGTQALASTLIPLHPLAVAGYFSLFVNALSLIPVGRTDGGRISMALFGRSGCQAVTFLALSTMFLFGLSSSDLVLFYFGFAVFFQNELEIPMRNEVDDVELPRVLLASFAWFLMLLTLIPM